jgi:hypothetical protein
MKVVMEMNNNNAVNADEDIMNFDTDFAPIVEQDFDADVQATLDAIDTELTEEDFADAFDAADREDSREDSTMTSPLIVAGFDFSEWKLTTLQDIPMDKMVWELERMIFGDDHANPNASRVIKMNGVDLRFTRWQLENILAELRGIGSLPVHLETSEVVLDIGRDALTSNEWDAICEPSDDPMDRN